MSDILVSIIIPTFNRASSLTGTVDAISQSNFDLKQLEVIVVDDGSSDNTSDIQKNTYPFSLRYHKQSNQGDAKARNSGAQISRGELLIFLDDDIGIAPDFIENMKSVHGGEEGVIVVGNLVPANLEEPILLEKPIVYHGPDSSLPVPFSECKSGFMAIARKDFLRLGMMQPLAIKGSSIWCDVELAYRAYLENFTFLMSLNAIGYHYDYTERNLETRSKRVYRVAKDSILLFQRHPQLQAHLPMFHDKTPIAWGKDGMMLTIRKIIRSLASILVVIRSLEMLNKAFAASGRLSNVRAALERWIIGGYIYRGYRQGLREHGSVLPDH